MTARVWGKAILTVKLTDGRVFEVEWPNPEVKLEISYPFCRTFEVDGGERLARVAGMAPDVTATLSGTASRLMERSGIPALAVEEAEVSPGAAAADSLRGLLAKLRDGGGPCPSCDQTPCAPDCKLAAAEAQLQPKEEG